MNNLYFSDVVNIGHLYLDYVFFEFESEPILFICKDKKMNLYLCLCAEIRYGQKWIVSQCKINVLKALIEEKIDVASALLTNKTLTVITLDLDGTENSSLIDSENIDRLDLPKEGTYIRCDRDNIESYLWNKEYEYLKARIHTFSPTTSTVTDSYCEKIKTIFNMPNIGFDKYLESEELKLPVRSEYCLKGIKATIGDKSELNSIQNNSYSQAA